MSDHNDEIFAALGIPITLVGSSEWDELEQLENTLGEQALINQIMEKKLWSNAEIAWTLKKMLYYYGRRDELLKESPVDRIFLNMANVLRCFFLIIDSTNPNMDDNMRSYISSKLADATWGINSNTRKYLHKINKNNDKFSD